MRGSLVGKKERGAMGGVNSRCALTGLPILEGDPVYLMFLDQNLSGHNRHKWNWRGNLTSSNPCRYWRVLGLPLEGICNGHHYIYPLKTLEDQTKALMMLAQVINAVNEGNSGDFVNDGEVFSEKLTLPSNCWGIIDVFSDAVLKSDFHTKCRWFAGVDKKAFSWILIHKWAYLKAVQMTSKYFDPTPRIRRVVEDPNEFDLAFEDSTGKVPNYESVETVKHKISFVSTRELLPNLSIVSSWAWYQPFLQAAYTNPNGYNHVALVHLLKVLWHMGVIGRYLLPYTDLSPPEAYLGEWFGAVGRQATIK